MKIRNLLPIFLLLLSAQFSLAQKETGDYSITGSIVDSTNGKTLDFITINVMRDKGTSFKVVYSKTDGSFLISGISPGKYEVGIVGVGYRTKRIQAELTDSTKKSINLGIITLGPEVVGLKEVVITAIKPIIKQEVDRITYDLQADPESKIFSVLDMMRKIPYLSLDADNNLYMKGNSDFKILINGKPSSMMERNYKDVLRSMPASSIERIEVITSPSSKYDAEGLAGIINIITNKKVDNGYNGSLNVSEKFPIGGPGVGGSISAKIGKLGISGFGGANIYKNPTTRNTIGRNTFSPDVTNLVQEGNSKTQSKNGYLGLEMSYEADSLNLVSAQFNVNGNTSDGNTFQQSSLTGAGENLQGYNITGKNQGQGTGMDASVNYQKGFRADKNRLLTLSYRMYAYSNNQNADLNVSGKVNYEMPDYRQVNDQHFSEQTFQLDYVHPWKKIQIEGGLKAILRNNNSDFQYLLADPETGVFVLQENMSNKFRNRQNVFGAYNTYQYNIKNWGFKAGVRIEETVIDADFVSTESKLRRTYFNVIPSVSVNRKLKNNSAINFAYTQRIQRPGIYQLNPFVDRSNPNFERTGNPYLRPALFNDLQLGFSKPGKVTLNLGLGINFFRDLFFPVSVYDSTTNITRSSYGNTGTAKLPMLYVNLSFPINKKWNLSMNNRVGYGMVQGTINGIKIKNEGLMYNLFLTTGYKLEKDWRLNASANLNGPSVQFQGTSNITFNSSFSISKDLIKEKLSLSASVNNPFTKFRKNYTYTFGPDFQQRNYRWDYFRSFNVSLNYKFGKLKETIKKNSRGIRNDDVQGGN